MRPWLASTSSGTASDAGKRLVGFGTTTITERFRMGCAGFWGRLRGGFAVGHGQDVAERSAADEQWPQSTAISKPHSQGQRQEDWRCHQTLRRSSLIGCCGRN